MGLYAGGAVPQWRHCAGSISPRQLTGVDHVRQRACQILAIVLTAILWSQWQAKLSKDPLGSRSPYLNKILATHWIRTLFINAHAFILLAWALQVVK